MADMDNLKDHFETLAVGNHWSPPSNPTPVTVPIYPCSTFNLSSVEEGSQLAGGKEGYFYSRWCNPTIHAACQTITKLEEGAGTLVFSSGMAAITTALMAVLKAGDHIIIPNMVYSGTKHLTQTILPRFGVEVTFVDQVDVECYRKAIKPNTKILFGETPRNPTMAILDLEEFGKLRKSLPDVMAMVDSTFGSPYNQNVLKYGIDVVIHSCTKYLAGHSDLIAGSITSTSKELHTIFHEHQKIFGSNSSPFDSYLLLRGIKTLHLRMERHNHNGLAIARHLEKHPKVKCVLYPGLESHPQHNLAKKQMRGFGGMLSFDVHGGFEAAVKFVESVKVIKLAVSLGSPESLTCLVASAVHHDKYMSTADKERGGVSNSLIRMSVGLEHEDDLKRDIDQALSQL